MNVIWKNILKWSAWFVALCGFLIYGYVLYIWTIEWQQNQYIHESKSSAVLFVISDVIFASGLAPMLLVIYYLVLGKTERDWGVGMLLVFLSIPVHFYVTGVAAHTTPSVYIPFQLGELVVVIGLILHWHRKYRAAK